MKNIDKKTELELIKMIKNMMKDEDNTLSTQLRRRINNDEISDLIQIAKDEVDEDDFDDNFEYLDNVIGYVIQELQDKYGENDDFWYDNEDEIIDYIKDNFDDELFG
jgi:hypothetical protein